ncbi:MAG: lysine--tRNA ligase [Actinomycetota bacterium]|nr:lysine--tRNA ligase [Actinomycetota bacterium]
MTEPEIKYPYRYERTATVADVRQRFDDIEAGADTGTTLRLAGRLRTVRAHGKVAFADLQDSTGTLQLFAQVGVLGDDGMDAFTSLGVGDIVGAEGEIVKTRRGELSLRVAEVTLLAPCLRPMPDKWHEMSDVEVRYRQRYLDLIQNPTPRRVIEARSALNATIRSFFDERGFVEVETPLLQPIASGAVARPFVTHHNALDIDLYLRVAPELYLKRLLIGGVERVYELNRSFRNEGVSARHNPEFTMLEAYEAYSDFNDFMTLVEDLVKAIAEAVIGDLEIETPRGHIDLAKPFRRASMFETISEVTKRDLEPAWHARDWDAIETAARELEVRVDPAWSAGKVVAEIFETTTEKALVQPTFVTGFPKEVSPLAKDHRTLEGFTEHSDLVIGGLEIAPIYSELNDPEEQRRRFEQQAAIGAQGDEEVALPDADFLEALAYGMPPAAGFGLGVDRLLTLLLGESSLREIILFPTLKPEA